jgi:hypothetical protein
LPDGTARVVAVVSDSGYVPRGGKVIVRGIDGPSVSVRQLKDET